MRFHIKLPENINTNRTLTGELEKPSGSYPTRGSGILYNILYIIIHISASPKLSEMHLMQEAAHVLKRQILMETIKTTVDLWKSLSPVLKPPETKGNPLNEASSDKLSLVTLEDLCYAVPF